MRGDSELAAKVMSEEVGVAPPALEEQRIRHLELIQGVIARLASNAFLMKGWALTVSGVFFGFSAKDVDWRLALVGLMPLVAFWGLDGYFLSRERMFRALYDGVRTGEPRVEPFSMNYTQFRRRNGSGANGWLNCMTSGTVAWFYGPVLVVGVLLVIVTASHR
jgi:hypothetical protein